MTDLEFIEVAKILNKASALVDESYISFPISKIDVRNMKKLSTGTYKTKNATFDIYIRTFAEAKRAQMAAKRMSSEHSVSIKIRKPATDESERIKIPTKSFLTDDKEARDDYNELEKFGTGSSNFKDTAVALRRFIYDNQMLIVAIWFNTNEKVSSILIDRVKSILIDMEYYSNKSIRGPKSQEELDGDKQELTEYVRKELSDPSIELYFEEQKKSKEEKKANKKRK